LIDPIVRGLDAPGTLPVEMYEPGSDGPDGARDLLTRDGFEWVM
jgi:glucose-6-phosphate 1-dehydrogenase